MLLTMDGKSPIHLIAIAVVFLLFGAHVRRQLQIRAFKRAHNCQPPVRAPQSERILGISSYLKLRRIRREHISVRETTRRALEIGRTNTAVVLGQNIVSTCDPENVKAVLATNFTDYGIGPRIDAMGPLLGKGIFTLDDVPWQHSRVRFILTPHSLFLLRLQQAFHGLIMHIHKPGSFRNYG